MSKLIYEKYKLRGKGTPENINVRAKFSAQGDKSLKKSLMLNRIKGGVSSEPDPTQLNFLLVERIKGKLKQ